VPASYLRQIARQASHGLPLLRPARVAGRPIEAAATFDLSAPLTPIASLPAPPSTVPYAFPGPAGTVALQPEVPTPSAGVVRDETADPAPLNHLSQATEGAGPPRSSTSRPVAATQRSASRAGAAPEAPRPGPARRPSPSTPPASYGLTDSRLPRSSEPSLAPRGFDFEPATNVAGPDAPARRLPSPPSDAVHQAPAASAPVPSQPDSAFARLEQLALQHPSDALPPTVVRPVTPARVNTERSSGGSAVPAAVHIGSIEVNVTPPEPAPARREGRAPAPTAPLSRGYAPVYGLRQG
jgi:hypothetical protein